MASCKYLPPSLAESLLSVSLGVRRPTVGPRQGLHRSRHYGASVEFAEYRSYTPGDPTALIDWRVYARSDRYVVRRYLEETNLLAFILLDTSGSLRFRDEGPMLKIEYACFLAAGLLYALVRQGDRVSLATFDSRLRRTFEPTGAMEGLRPMLDALEQVEASGEGDIEAALHAAADSTRSKALFIVISDFLQEPGRLVRGLRRLHHDGHNIWALHVMDRGERRLSFGGVADIRDIETSRRLVVDVDEVRAAYESAADRHVETIRLACADCLADYCLADTAQPVEETLGALGRQTG